MHFTGQRWLGGRGFDLVFFFIGTPLLAVAAGLALIALLPAGAGAALSVGALLYVAINAIRDGVPGVPLFLEPGSDGARLGLGVYWGVFFHHYYLDQHIWRPSGDPALRVELGLDSVAERAVGESSRTEVVHP